MKAHQTLERTLHVFKAWTGSGPRSHSWFMDSLAPRPRCPDSQAKQAEPSVPLGSVEHRDHQLARKAAPHGNPAWLTLFSRGGLLTPMRPCCPRVSIFTTHTHTHAHSNSHTLHAYLPSSRLSGLTELVLEGRKVSTSWKILEPSSYHYSSR